MAGPQLPPGFSLIDEPAADTGAGPLVVTVRPQRQSATLPDGFTLIDDEPGAWDAIKSTAADVVQSLPTGIIKGAIGLASLPGEAARAVGTFADAAAEKITGTSVPAAVQANSLAAALGNDSLTKKFEAATGKLYEPQTRAGKFARTVGEFVPMAGGGIANQLRMAVAPGLASEAAGQIAEGTGFEQPARIAAALTAGLGASMVGRGNRAPEALAPALHGIDDASLMNARAIMDDASRQGITLTWDEAINHATKGATNLGDVRRIVEKTPEGGAVLRPIMAERPGQVEAAARRTFDDLAPQPANPSSLGREAGAIAENRVNSVRDAINTASDPSYAAASGVRLGPAEMARVRALPGYPEAVEAIRKDPQLARYVQGMPEDSVGFLNEVKKQLDTSAANAASPVNAQKNAQRSAGYGSDAAVVKQVGEAASPDYARALAIQAQGRDQILQPILDGPIGKIASRDTTTRQALDALFPKDPLAGSAGEVSQAMQTLVRSKPVVAQQLVRLHAEGVFNQAAKNLQAGENVMGGAKFAAAIRGNAQQAENLEAAVKALPQGDVRWKGFNNLLDVLEATGRRPAPNSVTAIDTVTLDRMKGGTKAGEVGNAILTGGLKLPSRISKWYEGVQQGRNAEGLAKILVDPNALPLLRALAREPSTGSKAIALSSRLGAMAAQASRD